MELAGSGLLLSSPGPASRRSSCERKLEWAGASRSGPFFLNEGDVTNYWTGEPRVALLVLNPGLLQPGK
jgi:hypothetical protein